ncbi:hypothetical protein ABU614_04910 [Lysobacter firmicutimachus]|uniref:Uncharacterized protein n=1 Tax=Lysobacter firmicutimachus TaxID=1792846 RepID=A0AAU8MV46_9GAMM
MAPSTLLSTRAAALRRRPLRLGLAATLWLAGTWGVAAQDNAPLIDGVGAYTHSQIMRHRDDAEPGRREARPRARGQQAPARGGATLDSLDFAPRPAVSAALNAAFADSLTGRRPSLDSEVLRDIDDAFERHPQFRRLLAQQIGGDDRGRVLQALQSGRLQAQFGQRLQAHGYSARNFGDVLNAFMIYGWTLANDGARSDHDAAFSGLRARLADSLARGQKLTSMRPQQLQEAAELYGLVATLAGAAWQNARSPAERASVRDGMAAIGRTVGIDFRTVALRDGGFAPKR